MQALQQPRLAASADAACLQLALQRRRPRRKLLLRLVVPQELLSRVRPEQLYAVLQQLQHLLVVVEHLRHRSILVRPAQHLEDLLPVLADQVLLDLRKYGPPRAVVEELTEAVAHVVVGVLVQLPLVLEELRFGYEGDLLPRFWVDVLGRGGVGVDLPEQLLDRVLELLDQGLLLAVLPASALAGSVAVLVGLWLLLLGVQRGGLVTALQCLLGDRVARLHRLGGSGAAALLLGRSILLHEIHRPRQIVGQRHLALVVRLVLGQLGPDRRPCALLDARRSRRRLRHRDGVPLALPLLGLSLLRGQVVENSERDGRAGLHDVLRRALLHNLSDDVAPDVLPLKVGIVKVGEELVVLQDLDYPLVGQLLLLFGREPLVSLSHGRLGGTNGARVRFVLILLHDCQ